MPEVDTYGTVQPHTLIRTTYGLRTLRHFAVSRWLSGMDALQNIYKNILQQHLSKSAASFLPTAVKFHYVFNLRDLSNIFQGLIIQHVDCLQHPLTWSACGCMKHPEYTEISLSMTRTSKHFINF
ncbi:Dynein beta chain, ciliary [Orchesella cincta]|uniref:Dynein beta chain, ciliary n=1 Tax=Orchesella cincta TaxID=48709 RepID=A0A1D2MUP3_ORCCI|nr:Dynein beta chain, ciliary [Orchesella cincta]